MIGLGEIPAAAAADPLSVGLKFGFLGVLYLFLLWVARSALREVRAGTGAGLETGVHKVASAARTEANLVVLRGGGLEAGERYDLFGGAMIGRSPDADVRIEDRFASGLHARIYARGRDYFLEDLDSTNGTFLNEEGVSGEVKLTDLDEIRIGDTEWRFELELGDD